MSDSIKKAFPVKFKKDEAAEVLEFANIQSNFCDTVRYLIEKEISENGIRNIQKFIPPVRDAEYFNSNKISKQNQSSDNKIDQPIDIKIKSVPKCYD